MDSTPQSHLTEIVVVGGTAAGWAAAARLASAFRGTVFVTVLETPERSSETMENQQVGAVSPEVQRNLFDSLGVAEDEWVRACRASFATAVRHVNRRTEGGACLGARAVRDGGPDHFYLPRAEMPECEDSPLLTHWQFRRSNGVTVEPFDHACFREPPLMDAGKSPRWLDGRAALPYGWHVDIRMFTEHLRSVATGRFGVRSVRGELNRAEFDGDGMLTALHLVKGPAVTGDFFLDCTGPEGRLIAGVLGEPFVDAREGLLCDSAVTMTVPCDRAGPGLDPFTTVTALPAGWAWTMPLSDGTGAGHVYAREWTEPEEAADVLRGLWGLRPGEGVVRHLRHRVGRRRRAWVKNCVAVGPSAWTLEPSAGEVLHDVLPALDRLVRDFPSKEGREAPAARFNRAVESRYARAHDHAQLLYAGSPRADTPFWKARHEPPLSAALEESAAAYRAGLPPEPRELDHFVLLAALSPDRPAPPAALAHRATARALADAHFMRIKRQQHILLETLPTAREYLDRLHARRNTPPGGSAPGTGTARPRRTPDPRPGTPGLTPPLRRTR